MSSVIKVNACVYSRKGYGREKNTSSFYMNGKFTSELYIDNMQASMENRGANYLFAVADNMDCEDPDQNMDISMLKEITKTHEKLTVNDGDISSNIKELESRVNDTERLISSILEMNKVPLTDTRWNLGFSGLLLLDGQFAALTGGNGHVYMMRDDMFRSLANETTKAKRAIDAKNNLETEVDEVEIPGEEKQGSVIVSDVYDLHEGDSFVLITDGVLEALGEEKIEDMLAMRSDSSYIAYRIIDEAMKRNSSGDLTAMVVQVEKIYNTGKVVKSKPQNKQKQTTKNNVEKFSKVPPVTYKYSRNKRRAARYQGTVYLIITILTVAIAFGFIYMMIKSLVDTGTSNIEKQDPSPTVTATPSETPDYEEPGFEEPTNIPDPIATPETPVDTQIKEHTVKPGESINKIVKDYYGDTSLVDKLCKYNNITNPNLIKVDQVIKIPPREVLEQQ